MDKLLNFRCVKCKSSIIDFERPDFCEDCNSSGTYEPCFSVVNTMSVSAGIMYEYMFDSAPTLGERNDVYSEDFEENKNRSMVSGIRNGKIEAVAESRTTESLESELDI